MIPPDDIQMYECAEAILWKEKGEVIFVKNNEGTYVDVEHQKQKFSLIKELAGNKPHRLIVDISGVKGVSREGREYTGLIEHRVYIRSIALLVSTPLSRIIGTFIMKVNRPNLPTKLFTNLDKAKKWLV